MKRLLVLFFAAIIFTDANAPNIQCARAEYQLAGY